jgi:hypothetical protein
MKPEDNEHCLFCGLRHPRCDLHHCYCGEEEPDINGEGYNEKCNEFWLGADKQVAS